MIKPVIAALLGSLAFASMAQALEFNGIRNDRSVLSFVYKQMGVPMEGHFKKFDMQLNFDPAEPTAAMAMLNVDLASIDTGSQEADDEVAGKAWFNTRAFPQARFISTRVKVLGGNRYEVSGTMSVKGRTQNISVPFSFNPQGNTAVIEGAFVFKRADFAIGEGMWADFGTVANEIQIKFRFLASTGK